MVLASRWYACKIGSERFTHYGNAVKRLMTRHTYILFTITHILLIIHLQTPKTRSLLNPLRVLMYYVCHIFLTLLSAQFVNNHCISSNRYKMYMYISGCMFVNYLFFCPVTCRIKFCSMERNLFKICFFHKHTFSGFFFSLLNRIGFKIYKDQRISDVI